MASIIESLAGDVTDPVLVQSLHDPQMLAQHYFQQPAVPKFALVGEPQNRFMENTDSVQGRFS